MTTRAWALMVQDDEGGVIRWTTAPYTPANQTALQEQADRMPGRAWVQTIEEQHQ